MRIDSFMHFSPSLIFILAGLCLPLIRNSRVRNFIALMIPIITCVYIFFVSSNLGNTKTLSLVGFTLQTLYVSEYTKIFGVVFCIAAFGGVLFGLNKVNSIEISSAFLYVGSSIGVLFCGDLITMFIFWELMAISSTFLVFMSSYKHIGGVGVRYACAHFLGGVLLMIGIIIHINLSGSSSLSSFVERVSLFSVLPFNLSNISVYLVLLGVLINAAAPPFSSWLPEAYSKASPFASVYLSAFTTKTSVFVLITIFAGTNILIYIGLFMLFYGVIYAMLENDTKRILGYSIINQVGLMIIGVGVGTDIALYGVAAHAFCHIMYKCLLFMSASSVFYMTKKYKLTDLGGLHSSMPITSMATIIGSLTIFFTSFVSKYLILLSVAKANLLTEWALIVALSIGVFMQAVIRYPWFLFFSKKASIVSEDPPLNMRIAMIVFSAFCLLLMIPGVGNRIVYNLLPAIPEHFGFGISHIVVYIQQLSFSILAFYFMYNFLKPKDTVVLDFDWLYRRLFVYISYFFEKIIIFRFGLMKNFIIKFIKKTILILFTISGPDGVMSKRWAMSTSLTLVLSMLFVYFFIYYLS